MGFVRLFGVVGSFLVKPQFLKNLDEEFFAYRLEEDCIRRRSVLDYNFYREMMDAFFFIYLLDAQIGACKSNGKIVRFSSTDVHTSVWFGARR